MIEIGKNFLWGLASAKQTVRQEKEKNKLGALQAEQQANALQQAYEEKMNYLFRSSVEKTQLAYQNARKQLAALQAKRAANGITDQSASVIDETQTSALQQAQNQQQAQAALQETATQQTTVFERAWNELRNKIADYRKKAKHKNRLGSLGRAIISLFD